MRKRMKAMSLLLAAAVAVAPLAAAAEGTVDESRKSTANSDEKYEKLVVAIGSDPQDLLPCNYNTGDRKYIFKLIYQTLFWENGTDVYEPLIGKNYTEVDDLHCDVEIYDNVYDSAGNHITADDVVYSYNYLQETGYAVKYDYYESVEKVDDYTVRFTWTKPITSLSALQAIWGTTIIFSQKAFEEGNFATEPVGTGRYVVDSFTSGSSVVCSVNENYWQEDELAESEIVQANVQTIEFDVIAEAAQQVIALQNGTVDFVASVSADSIGDFQEGGAYADQYSVISELNGQWWYITPNQLEGHVGNDINFRLAVYYALNNEAIATAVGNCEPMVTIGSSYQTDIPAEWFEEETYINTFDPELAKEYLDKSSYNGETLKLMGDNSANAKNALTMIQALLKNVGIETELAIVEANLLPNYCADETAWDLYVTYGAGGANMINGLNRILNKKEYGNDMAFGFVADDTLEETFQTAYSLEGHTDENMTALKNYILENAYHDFLFAPYQNMIASADIAEVAFFPGGIQPNFSSFTFYLE
ncbi:MAG: ABC transporter substrate-binding protein [Eubacteriales bacterium]|nr:ABC transporter substrate-binding protein [Eubacteriales bacterium]